MDNINLLNLKEKLESAGSSLFVLFFYFFLVYSNGEQVYGL